MSNPFYYLVGLFLAFSYPTGGEPLRFVRQTHAGGIPVALWATAGALAAYGLLAWVVHRWLVAGQRRWIVGLARALLRLMGLLFYAALVYLFHFPLWLWSLGLEDSLFFGGLASLAPLMALYAVLGLVAARAEPRLRGAPVTAGGYLLFAFRTFLSLSLIPVLFMLGLNAAIQEVEPLRDAVFVYPFLGWGVVLAAVGLLLAILPLLLRLTLAARPLSSGPLRDRLTELCRRQGFRWGELLSVPTSGLGLANAFIVGLPVPVRYVFFTDAILAGMRPELLECVLAHEIMHAKRRHILYYLFFSLGFVLLGALAGEFLSAVGARPAAAVLFVLGVWGLFWFVIFGFVSRRFESEADLGAARLDGEGPAPYSSARRMAAALETVAALNRVPVRAWSWRHFSILTRIRILVQAELAPGWGESFEKACRGLRGAAAAFLLAGAAGGALLGIRQAGQAEENRRRLAAYESIERGHRLAVEERFDEAARELREGIRSGADDPEFWLWLAECERRAGRESLAQEALAEARARQDRLVHPRSRLQLNESPAQSP